MSNDVCIRLYDDGTLDTVFEVFDRRCQEVSYMRWSDTSDYRDENGVLDEDLFVMKVVRPEYDELLDNDREAWREDA